jgi:outer membrane protein, heavy metal efflux system
MSRHALFAALLVLAVTPAARAQVNDRPPLTLDAAIREALAQNPELAALRRQFDVARQRPAQERFLVAPTFEAQIWQWPLSTLNPLDVNMYMFTIRQEIPGRGKRAQRAAALGTEALLASNDIAVRARAVINEVKQAYADLFVSRQAIAVHDESADLLRQTTELITARYGTGYGSQQDALKSIAALARLHTDLVTLQERADLAAVQLNVLLNRPPGSPVGALTVDADLPVPSADDLRRLALAQHPELRGARLAVERAAAAAAVANSGDKPDYMVGGGYQLMPRSAGAWMAMAGMTWPNAPWSRGRVEAEKAAAAAEIAAAQARQEAVAAAIGAAVQQAYIRVTAASSRASLLSGSVIPQTQQVFEASRIAYQSDRGDAAAVVENQRMLLDVQLDYYRALSDLQQARADLERAVGTDLPNVSAPAVALREVRR